MEQAAQGRRPDAHADRGRDDRLQGVLRAEREDAMQSIPENRLGTTDDVVGGRHAGHPSAGGATLRGLKALPNEATARRKGPQA